MSRPDTLLITGLTTPQIIRTAQMLDLPAILVARGKDVPQDVADLAPTTGIVLLSTHHIVYVASGKLHVRGLSG